MLLAETKIPRSARDDNPIYRDDRQFLALDDSQIPHSGATLQNYLPAKYFSSKILR